MRDVSNADQVRELARVIEKKAREAVPDGDYKARREHYLIQSVLLAAEQLAGIRDAVLRLEEAMYGEEEVEEP